MIALRNASVGFLTLALALPVFAQDKSTSAPLRLPTLRRGAPLTAVNEKAAAQLASSVDAGDSYRTPAGQRKLLRLAGAVAISSDTAAPVVQRQLTSPGQPLARYSAISPSSHGVTVLYAPLTGKSPQIKQAPALDELLKSVRATDAGKSANPVFIDPTTGLRLVATTELIVCLKPGSDAARFFGVDWLRVQPLWGTTDQFVLSVPGATAEEIFETVNRYAERPDVEWAEPNFIMEVAKTFTPNDAFFIDQWGLDNGGQFGGSTNAHVRAAAAWDITLGNSNIVIAIMDDGVQLDHPDLADNIFTNPGEIPDNGRDDDNNGFIDDVHGWDIYAKDNDPSPAHATDIHGTPLAGVAAAVGDNGLGISGVAPRCKILPLKVIGVDGTISATDVSRMLFYSAGLDAQGRAAWRGADVINISLLFSRSATVDAALNTAATKGRSGKGCAIFCAAGNGAGAWVPFEVEFETAGFYTLSWEYTKDRDDEFSTGADTVWLDNIVFPNGVVESFEGGALPDGWSTGGDAPWQFVTDGVAGNRALTGWTGPGSRSIRAGRITHNQLSYLELTTFIESGVLRFWAWTESEAVQSGENVIGFDIFHFYVDNGITNSEIDFDFGVPLLETGVAYPASHPQVFAVGASTDFDFRADYSTYGATLDFVAPSDGGNAAISTTDRTGIDGYNPAFSPDGDFAHDFGGTSSAAPLAAGISALLLSANPYLSLADVRALLTSTADHIGDVAYDEDGFNPFYGHGRLNAERAVRRARPNLIVSVAPGANPVVLGDTSTFMISVRNNGTGISGPASLTSHFPAGVGVGSITPAPSSRLGNQLIFNTGNMASGALLTFKVTVTNLTAGTNISIFSAGTDIAESVMTDNSVAIATVVVPKPEISITGTVVTEADIQATNAVFIVSLSNPSSRAITVRYAAASGAATLGRDFAAASGLLRFAPGETAKTISVRVLPDRLDEDDENFFLNLIAPVNATLAAGQGIGRILDNDPLPALSISDARRAEGNAGTAPMVFTVRLSAPSGRPVSAQFETASGSAIEGIDFVRTNGTLVFPPGRTLLTIPVRILGDTMQETNETFQLQLGNPPFLVFASLADGQGTGTIVNDDATPRLFISNSTVTEGDTGETNAVFNVRLIPASGLTVQVYFGTTNGSAGGFDYAATSGVLVFAPGETNQTITVPVLGDTLSESNEFFSVRLSAPTNAILGGALARATILDIDPLPTLSISDATVLQSTNAATNVVFTVALSAVSGRTITVRFATSNGTAFARADFIPRSGVLTFLPGATSREIVVAVNRATAGETNETFFVNLAAPANATMADGQGTGSILAAPTAEASGFQARINRLGRRR